MVYVYCIAAVTKSLLCFLTLWKLLREKGVSISDEDPLTMEFAFGVSDKTYRFPITMEYQG